MANLLNPYRHPSGGEPKIDIYVLTSLTQTGGPDVFGNPTLAGASDWWQNIDQGTDSPNDSTWIKWDDGELEPIRGPVGILGGGSPTITASDVIDSIKIRARGYEESDSSEFRIFMNTTDQGHITVTFGGTIDTKLITLAGWDSNGGTPWTPTDILTMELLVDQEGAGAIAGLFIMEVQVEVYANTV